MTDPKTFPLGALPPLPQEPTIKDIRAMEEVGRTDPRGNRVALRDFQTELLDPEPEDKSTIPPEYSIDWFKFRVDSLIAEQEFLIDRKVFDIALAGSQDPRGLMCFTEHVGKFGPLPPDVDINLLADFGGDFPDWEAREQYDDRNTCVAFSAASAVELVHFREDGFDPALKLSEEYCYATSRLIGVPKSEEPVDVESGGLRLRQARDAIRVHGICTRGEMPYKRGPVGGETVSPSADQHAKAAQRLRDCGFFWDQRFSWTGSELTHHPSEMIYYCLKNGLPCVLAFEVATYHQSTQNALTLNAGNGRLDVSANLPGRSMPENAKSGHAVVIYGAKRTGGGQVWFQYKNSFDGRWANAPISHGNPENAPFDGYGSMSGRFADEYGWEIYAPKPNK